MQFSTAEIFVERTRITLQLGIPYLLPHLCHSIKVNPDINQRKKNIFKCVCPPENHPERPYYPVIQTTFKKDSKLTFRIVWQQLFEDLGGHINAFLPKTISSAAKYMTPCLFSATHWYMPASDSVSSDTDKAPSSTWILSCEEEDKRK